MWINAIRRVQSCTEISEGQNEQIFTKFTFVILVFCIVRYSF